MSSTAVYIRTLARTSLPRKLIGRFLLRSSYAVLVGHTSGGIPHSRRIQPSCGIPLAGVSNQAVVSHQQTYPTKLWYPTIAGVSNQAVVSHQPVYPTKLWYPTRRRIQPSCGIRPAGISDQAVVSHQQVYPTKLWYPTSRRIQPSCGFSPAGITDPTKLWYL